MNQNEKLTWDDIKAMFAETREQLRVLTQREEEFYKQKEKDRREMEKDRKHMEKAHKVTEKERKEMIKNWNRMVAESYERNAILDKKFAELNRQLGGISRSNGDMAEEFFYNVFRKDKIFLNEKYDRIHRNYFCTVDSYRNEYDIVLFNGEKIAIIEIKYKARPDNVDIDYLIARIEHFKKYANEYKNHKIVLGVAAMSFRSGLATKLHKAGFVTIHPVGKKMMIYDKEAKMF